MSDKEAARWNRIVKTTDRETLHAAMNYIPIPGTVLSDGSVMTMEMFNEAVIRNVWFIEQHR